MQDHYTYKVTWSAEDGEYLALCIEFPSLSWLDETQEAALRGIRQLVADIVDDLHANKEPIPEPFATRQYSGKFLVRVPPSIHRHLTIAAAEDGVSLNRYINAKLLRE